MKLPVQWKYAVTAAGLVLLVILVMDFNRRLETMNRRDGQLAAVRADGTRVMQTQEALMTQVAYAGSDAAAAEWAYDNGQAKPGETLIQIIPGGGATPTVTPPPVEAATELPNWQVWWELFFGG